MGIDIQTRRIKGTPFKLVTTKKDKIVGIFDCNKWIEAKCFTPVHHKAVEWLLSGAGVEEKELAHV
jgi:hypothetical protein